MSAAESLRGRRVLVTGHTGFKGGWLAHWLADAGASVHGLALDPPSTPSLFELADLASGLASDARVDLRDADRVAAVVDACAPEVVLHLAAQPLVRRSYREPLATFDTNVMGTAALLEAARRSPSVRAIVVVTTDKVYESREWPWGYRETDTLGGVDPYSASKAAAELITASYRRAFFAHGGAVGLATARAGNVLGGGDFGEDRLVPDAVRAIEAGRPLRIRSPRSIRPWQHVLEPLSGYLRLAARLLSGDQDAAAAWNFGPSEKSCVPVDEVLARLRARFGARFAWEPEVGDGPHETHTLRLDASRARQALGWAPRWELDECLDHTCAWYALWLDGASKAELRSLMSEQIRAHVATVPAGAPR